MSTRPLVLAPHGVNTGKGARAGWGAFIEALLRGYGFDVDAIGILWESLDDFVLDGVRSFANPRVIDAHVRQIRDGFEGSPGVRRAVMLARAEGRPVVMLPHSWGNVLTYLLKAQSAWLSDVPMLGMAAPFTHQTLGFSLAWRGRAPDWPKDRGPPPVFVSNRDDKICSLSRWLPTRNPPRGTKIVWVEHDGKREQLTQEHEPWQYIATDGFQAAFQEALL